MNASPSPPAGSPYSWLAHAKSDLRITQICRSDSGVLPNQTVFHAQQAAEKAIKAVLLEHKIRFPRTHDLGELIVLIQQHAMMWPFAPDEVEALSPFAVETRYPDDSDPLSENEVTEAISLAEKVIEWAKKTNRSNTVIGLLLIAKAANNVVYDLSTRQRH
jgi:HEPN domain-containing protein